MAALLQDPVASVAEDEAAIQHYESGLRHSQNQMNSPLGGLDLELPSFGSLANPPTERLAGVPQQSALVFGAARHKDSLDFATPGAVCVATSSLSCRNLVIHSSRNRLAVSLQ